MITRDQALTLDKFHMVSILNINKCYVWRRNGQTQTWKTRPDDFRVPVKFGLRDYNQITNTDAHMFYAPEDCPVCRGSKY